MADIEDPLPHETQVVQLQGSSWRVVTVDMDGRESLSTAVSTRTDAVAWALELLAQGVTVARVKSADGEAIETDEIASLAGEKAIFKE